MVLSVFKFHLSSVELKKVYLSASRHICVTSGQHQHCTEAVNPWAWTGTTLAGLGWGAWGKAKLMRSNHPKSRLDFDLSLAECLPLGLFN